MDLSYSMSVYKSSMKIIHLINREFDSSLENYNRFLTNISTCIDYCNKVRDLNEVATGLNKAYQRLGVYRISIIKGKAPLVYKMNTQVPYEDAKREIANLVQSELFYKVSPLVTDVASEHLDNLKEAKEYAEKYLYILKELRIEFSSQPTTESLYKNCFKNVLKHRDDLVRVTHFFTSVGFHEVDNMWVKELCDQFLNCLNGCKIIEFTHNSKEYSLIVPKNFDFPKGRATVSNNKSNLIKVALELDNRILDSIKRYTHELINNTKKLESDLKYLCSFVEKQL